MGRELNSFAAIITHILPGYASLLLHMRQKKKLKTKPQILWISLCKTCLQSTQTRIFSYFRWRAQNLSSTSTSKN
jgi:predicted MFS family arabinose efflux permease